MFRLSFLITSNIYKNYFKGHHSWCNWMQKFFISILWQEIYALVHFSLQEATVFVHRKVLWPSNYMIFIVYMNWRTLQPTSFSSWWSSCILGSTQLVSHVLGAVHWKGEICHYRTSPIGYWEKCSIIGWYKVLRFLYL